MKKKLVFGFAWALILLGIVLIFGEQYIFTLFDKQPAQLSTKTIAKNEKLVTNYDWQSVKTLSASTIIKARTSGNDLKYVGLIIVPDIGLKLPILNGTTNENLAIGAGTMFANQKMGQGNYSLASHFVRGSSNKQMLFSPIYYKGRVGQRIYVTNLKRVYVYKTDVYKTVKSTAVDVVRPVPDKTMLTLITCNYTHDRGRVMMQGNLETSYKWENASKSIKAQFNSMIR